MLAAIWFGGAAFGVLLAALAVLALREWVMLVSPAGAAVGATAEYWAAEHGAAGLAPGALTGLAALAALLGSLIAAFVVGPLLTLPVVLALGCGVWGVARMRHHPHGGLMALGLPYIMLPMIAMLWLRDVPDLGVWLVLWLVLVVWATDIGGYVVGRRVGGPRLAPRLSPNKTWSGLFGAMAAAALLSGLLGLAVGAAQPALLALLAAGLAVVAQIGDLAESAVKRHFGVKDSGTLIPGHGGLLDRVDGLLAAAPVFALALALGGTGWWW